MVTLYKLWGCILVVSVKNSMKNEPRTDFLPDTAAVYSFSPEKYASIRSTTLP